MPSFFTRTLHQIRVELRRDRGPLLLWLLLLSLYAWEQMDTKSASSPGYLPTILPAAVGLFLLWRLVRADHPGSPDCATLTRPVGRGALWLAKLLMLLLFGLLPWFLAHALEWKGYGLGTLSWLGVALNILLPFCVGALALAWVASLPKTQGLWLLLPFVLVLVIPELRKMAPEWSFFFLDSSFKAAEKIFTSNDLNRCRAVVGSGLAILVFGAGWWRAAQGRNSTGFVITLLLLSGLVTLNWPWNWLHLEPARCSNESIQLHFGDPPSAQHQSLWPQLHLSGLAANEVASVIALAPIRPEKSQWPQPQSYSDFRYLNDNGQLRFRQRWMRVDHTINLSRFFPQQTIWIGDADQSRGALSLVIANEQKRSPLPTTTRWRLRLAIHRLRKSQEWPLHEFLHAPIQNSPAAGWRFQTIQNVSRESGMNLDYALQQRLPLTVPNSTHTTLRVWSSLPKTNLFFTLHTPCIDQVVCLHEERNASFWSRNRLWGTQKPSKGNLSIPQPVIHQHLTGLSTATWLNDTKVALWWADERGLIDLEISPEELSKISPALQN